MGRIKIKVHKNDNTIIMKINQYIFILFSLLFFNTIAEAQSLDSLLKKAYDNNPSLKSLQLEYEAALQKGPQVSQLQNPTVGIGVPVLQPETRLGPQQLSVSASQMFPWFGSLKAKEDVAVTMAKSKYESIAVERLNLNYRLKSAYYNLYLLNEQQAIVRENIRIFETIEKVALAKLESGKSIASDVLKVQIKIEDLKQKIQLLEEQKANHQESIAEAINEQNISNIHVDINSLQFAVLNYDIEAYKKNIERNHPIINQINWEIEVANKSLTLNDYEGKPSFGFGLDYTMVGNRTDAEPIDNGRDILVPKVMISLPIYRKKYTAKNQEETLKKEAYAYQKQSVTNQMVRDLQNYKSDYERAKLIFELAQKQIQLSDSAYSILMADYSSQGKRFDELMQLQSDVNRYELEIINAIVQSHIVNFKIERLTNF